MRSLGCQYQAHVGNGTLSPTSASDNQSALTTVTIVTTVYS